jgi:hypothetical protein
VGFPSWEGISLFCWVFWVVPEEDDVTLPTINKPKHPEKGEYKE